MHPGDDCATMIATPWGYQLVLPSVFEKNGIVHWRALKK